MMDKRFFERRCCIIGYDALQNVMQELLDDKSIRIEKEYPVLSCYSDGFDCGYDEDEIIGRLELYLDRRIIAVFKDETEVFFIFGKDGVAV